MDILTERWFGRARRRRSAAILSAVAMLSGLVAIQLATAPAGAQTVQETFELEGNPQDTDDNGSTTGPAKPEDWQSLLSGSANNNLVDLGNGVFRIAQTQVPIPDPEETDTTYYKGGGSKDEREISGSGQTWAHSATDVAPDKNSILNAAAVAYKVPDGPDGTVESPETDPDLVLDFTLDRLANDGDAVVGFWFFKNRVGQSTTDAQKFTGTHAVGDILVVSDFSGGGEVSTIRVYKWVGGTQKIVLLGGTDTATALTGGNQVDCAKPSPNPYVCGTANRDGNEGVATVWPYTPKTGPTGFYPKGSFYEGGINVSAIVPDSDECFASFLAMTRSSTSTTAQLKDFVLGDLPICAPSTTLSATPTVAAPEVTVVGDSVTYTFTETNNGNVPLTNVYLTDDHASCTLSPASVATLAPAASQAFTCSFASSAEGITTVTAIGHGTSALGEVTYCDDPATTANECGTGQIHDADEIATAKSVAITPGTLVDVSASPDPVRVGGEVTFTITETNDGSAPAGFTSYLAMTSVSVSTGVTACDEDLGTKTGDTGSDNVLSSGETWTYTCTVPAESAGTLSITATGTGVVLAGTTRARTVTVCANPSSPPAGTFCDATEADTASVRVINPSTSLTMSATAVITYSFFEKNDAVAVGDPPLMPPTVGVRTSVLTAATGVCNVSAPVYVGGDANNDFKLDRNETWEFSCVGSLAGPAATVTGTTSKVVTGVGDGVDATGKHITFCSPTCTSSQSHDEQERDRVTVTIENHAQGAG